MLLSRTARTLVRRAWISTSAIGRKEACRVPLDRPLETTADGKTTGSSGAAGAPPSFRPFESRVTELASGLKVATEPHHGDFVTIGAVVATGTRFESHYPRGVARLVEKMAFGETSDWTAEQQARVVDESSAMLDCQSTRDSLVFAASCHRSSVDKVLSLIANAVMRPVFPAAEVEAAQATLAFEAETRENTWECSEGVLDLIHQAAFRGNTLGFPRLSAGLTDARTKQPIGVEQARRLAHSFIAQFHTPDRIVVSGVGVEHETFVKSAEQLFDVRHSSWGRHPDWLTEKLPPMDDSYAMYTGGELKITRDFSNFDYGPSPFPDLAHFVLAFEGCSYRDVDFVPMCVLAALLGGGNSFSAGGPGKGMYTRFYGEVLNMYHFMYSARADNHAYEDTGLFTLTSSAPPDKIGNVALVLVHQALQLLNGFAAQDVARAKRQLQSQMMMNLETRPVMFEDLARQVAAHGRRIHPEEYMRMIDAVTEKDLSRVAERLLASRPSVAGYGKLDALPPYSLIDEAIATRDIKKMLETTDKKSRVKSLWSRVKS